MKTFRIFAVILSVSLALMVMCLTVSADYNLERQVREAQLKVLNAYCQGEITYDEYITKSNELTQQLYDETTVSGYISSEAEQIGNVFKGISNKIGATAQIYGDKAYQYVADCIVDYFDDYTALADIESSNNPDKKGYGAMITNFYRPQEYITQKSYADYFIINKYGSAYGYSENGYFVIEYYDKNGNLTSTSTKDNGGNISVVNDDYWLPSFYGDIRYEDGTQAPTDDEFVQGEVLDFSDTSDVDLDKLLQDILEELERQEPDLSNVEGLLESIYFRLGQLDSDNDNALLAEINSAILSLANSNNTNTTQLILKLDEIKQALNLEGEDENPEEQQPTDLTEVIDELKEINAGIKGLAAIEVVENIWELTEGEQQLFNEYASLIPLIVDKLGIGLVQATMSDIESLIFTSSPPSDLTVEMYGSEYAVLSRDMFNDEALKYVNLAKNFVTVLIIYAWCMSMRKKLGGVE